jgi:hypothetical protein
MSSWPCACLASPSRLRIEHARAAQPGEDRGDDLVAEGEQGGDRALMTGLFGGSECREGTPRSTVTHRVPPRH